MTDESKIREHFDAHVEAIRAAGVLLPEISAAGTVILDRLGSGGKLLAFGNGGSSAQADHFVGELIGRYRVTRRPIPAVSLPASPGAVTCIANDFSFEEVFERQVQALANESDLVVGLTTSGSSKNVLRGLKAGREAGAATIAMTGGGGIADAPADHIISVPSASTARIQEIHLLIIHIWCDLIDDALSDQP